MTDTTEARPGKYEQIARRVVAWQEIALNDEGAPVLTMSRAVLNDLVADTELVLRDLERALAWKAEATEVLSAWHDFADELIETLDPVDTLGRNKVDVVRAALAAERARCDEIAGFVREHRARIHRPTCMDGQGCRCGLIDLPMWGERDERRGVRA